MERHIKSHIKNWVKHFGVQPDEYFPCECGCQKNGQQYHHITPRSKFGSKRKAEQDHVSNVARLFHECHTRAHASPQFNQHISQMHRKNLLKHSNNPDDLTRLI